MTEPTVCPTNLNAAGRRRRLVLGSVALAATIAAHFVWPPPPGSWRPVPAFVLLIYGWLCVMQALGNTCVVLAAKGTREVDGGTESVTDAALAAALRRRALIVYANTLVAVVLTIGALWALRHFWGL